VSKRAGAAHEPRLARVAAMVADPARSRMLAFLLDGAYASAGELARAGGVQASTASAHLAQLVEVGLVACEPRGRHRYFRLADGEVAQALNALALVAERHTHDAAWRHPERAPLREARCCYGHLAGRLGVSLFDRLRAGGCLREGAQGLELTDAGRAWLHEIGVAPPRASASQRLAYGCLDWSERRDHLAGSLARALLTHFLDRGWLRRAASPAVRGGHRVVQLTPAGRRHLLPLLGLD
jgi:DNA-binding transcriptional ArsR family regulator